VLRRLAAVGVVVSCLLPLSAGVAVAHNGVGANFKGRVGAYEVYAYDAFLSHPSVLTYRLVVLSARDLQPIYDVHAAVTASRLPDDPPQTPASAVGKVTTYGNVFFYDLPNPFPGHWLVHLRLSGRLGAARVSYRMHGLDAAPANRPVASVTGGGVPWLAVAGGVAGAIALAAAAAVTMRRRASGRKAAA
jgi:hypothetical protein